MTWHDAHLYMPLPTHQKDAARGPGQLVPAPVVAAQRCRGALPQPVHRGGKTPTFFDMCKRLTTMRASGNDGYPLKAQRSILQRVRLGYDKFLGDKKGLHRLGREVHSFELDGAAPWRNGPYYTLQIKGVGKLRAKDSRSMLSGPGIAGGVRIVRQPLGTGYDVQLVASHPITALRQHARAAIGIDVGVKANCSLSDGTQYDAARLGERKRKRLQKAAPRRTARLGVRRSWSVSVGAWPWPAAMRFMALRRTS